MKFKTRLIIAFFTVIMVPVVLTSLFILLLGRYQISSIEKTYGLTGTTVEVLTNPVQVLGQLTVEPCHELRAEAVANPDKLEDATYLNEFNEMLADKKSCLIVRKDDTITYMGGKVNRMEKVLEKLPSYGNTETTSEAGLYFGGNVQILVKQIDFQYSDGADGSAFIVTDVGDMIPEIREFAVDVLIVIGLVLIFTAAVLVLWIYRAVMQPLGRMQQAAQYIKEGNLDFEMKWETDDELGQLCRDFEEMRRRLKTNTEEKLAFDKENKELISNISHDLKTPVTTIKGYAEGIMDGVADTPEKLEKYTLSVNNYFNDCAEDLALELEQRGVEFGYFNYVEEDVRVIADAEQIKRVIHNIINNSLKYIDKPKGKINLRVKDVGDFVQVELEDNGCGIAAKDLTNIFERFYRTDASLNSSKGGSGIGLSVVKKIIEDHGGKIWATSREGTGTTMYFVLRKYQEVPVNE